MADDRLIVALDFHTMEEVKELVTKLGDSVSAYKVGMELYYSVGRESVIWLKKQGKKVFLDLKLHDIPNTVKKSMAVLSRLDVDMCNLHAAGTIAMMEAALEGLTRPDGTRPLLIAVTQLTSTDEDRMRYEGGQFFIKSEEDMRALFPYAPEAIDNTQKIADRCNVEIEFGKSRLPHFEVPEGYDSWTYLNKLCYEIGRASCRERV